MSTPEDRIREILELAGVEFPEVSREVVVSLLADASRDRSSAFTDPHEVYLEAERRWRTDPGFRVRGDLARRICRHLRLPADHPMTTAITLLAAEARELTLDDTRGTRASQLQYITGMVRCTCGPSSPARDPECRVHNP